MTFKFQLQSIPDDELLRRLSELLKKLRRVESELVAHIGEVDSRRLYAREACSSMFSYCIEVLHLSEFEAYLRIGVARAARQHPVLLEMLADGRLHLSGIAKLAPHLTESNCDEVLARATHKSKRQIEELIAELTPRPDVRTKVRKVPERPSSQPTTPPVPLAPTTGSGQQLGPDQVATKPAPVRRSQPTKPVEPLSPSRYKIQFTASAELYQKLQRLQALTGANDLAEVIEEAVTEKLERVEARRFGKTENPRKTVEDSDTSPSSRHIPAAVKRAVRLRDGDRCTVVDAAGRRCTERDRLEFHHRRPFARGGDHSVENIALVCRAHNGYFAEKDYGKEVMNKYRRPNRVSEPAPVYASPCLSLTQLSVKVAPPTWSRTLERLRPNGVANRTGTLEARRLVKKEHPGKSVEDSETSPASRTFRPRERYRNVMEQWRSGEEDCGKRSHGEVPMLTGSRLGPSGREAFLPRR